MADNTITIEGNTIDVDDFRAYLRALRDGVQKRQARDHATELACDILLEWLQLQLKRGHVEHD